MQIEKEFDVIIIGGSYSGLSAAMALGRALRNILVIDSGKPCNSQTPHSHNFLTQDGNTPQSISSIAKQQVEQYKTVEFYEGLAVDVAKLKIGFEITTEHKDSFFAKKLIFATGIKDIMPNINGFNECWGKSIIHCPYCHGYEVRHKKTGIFANGDIAFHYAQLIYNWTKDLTIFTNGTSTLNPEQVSKIRKQNIPVIETPIKDLKHSNGQLQSIILSDGSTFNLNVIYSRPNSEQHCKLPELLGCELTDQGLIKVDMFQKTTINNVYACGDNSSPLRSVSYAVATGNIAGAVLNNGMTEEEF